MAALNPKKGPGHPWWSIAAAILAVYDKGNDQAVALMEEAFAANMRD